MSKCQTISWLQNPFCADNHDISSLSVPCAPVNVTAIQLCGTDGVRVSWAPSALPFNYSVSAALLDGSSSSATCDTSLSNCDLSGLQCGQAYNVSVKASSGSCSGPYSFPQTVHTGRVEDGAGEEDDAVHVEVTSPWRFKDLF